jgi:hypothetical protein
LREIQSEELRKIAKIGCGYLCLRDIPKTRYFVMLGQHGYKAINRNVR